MANTRQFTNKQVKAMRKMRETGSTYAAIADKYGRSIPTIRKICRRETYTDVE